MPHFFFFFPTVSSLDFSPSISFLLHLALVVFHPWSWTGFPGFVSWFETKTLKNKNKKSFQKEFPNSVQLLHDLSTSVKMKILDSTPDLLRYYFKSSDNK